MNINILFEFLFELLFELLFDHILLMIIVRTQCRLVRENHLSF